MRIAVTGANGYLGTGICKQLLDDGHEVIAIDTKFINVDQRAKCIECDIFSVSEPFNYFSKPDIVLHLAWRNGFVHNELSHIEDLPLHYQFLKKLIENGLKQVAVLGTMHEIGFYEGSINEHTPTNPQSLYGIAKDALRKSVYLLSKENDCIFQWIRGYYIVGNTEYGSSIFSKITQAEREGKTFFPFTSGQNQWDFIDYDEFSKQVALIIEQIENDGIINACSGYPEKLSSRVERFIKENDFKIQLKYGAFPDRPYDSKAVWGDNRIINEIKERHYEKDT